MTPSDEQRRFAETQEHAVQTIATDATKRRLRAEVWAHVYATEFAVLRSNLMRDGDGAEVTFTSRSAREQAEKVAGHAAADFDTYCRSQYL